MSSSQVYLNPPFRAEHVGSLLRPSALFQKRSDLAEKKCTADELTAFEDEVVRKVVQLQKDAGIKTITDGEVRRTVFFEGVFDRLEGMTSIPNRPIETFKPYIPHIAVMYAYGVKESETIYCTGKVKRNKAFYVEDFKYLKSLVSPEEVKNIKITIVSPSWFHQRHGSDLTYDLNVYKNDTEYFDDVGKAFREEIDELYSLGCRHIQIDDPTFCYFCSEAMISGMEAAGVDHQALLDTYIRAINVCVKDRPSDLCISVHTCRGNFVGGVHFSEGAYDRIAIKLFNNLDVNTFYLEYDTPRAGNFEALKHLPPNKVAVLGLVTTKTPQLETVANLKARVDEAAEVMTQGSHKRTKAEALNQLCISTQCGFASAFQGNPVTEEEQIKKLQLLVETAKEIWPEGA